MSLTLQPSNLSCGTVALLVSGGDAEDDGRLGGVVDVGVGETGRLHQARGVGSTVHAHKGQLGRSGGLGLGRLVALDGQVHRILDDLAGRHRGGLPGQVSAIGALRHTHTHTNSEFHPPTCRHSMQHSRHFVSRIFSSIYIAGSF